jgi:hypothetical protein
MVEGLNKTVLDFSRDASDSLVGDVRKAIGDVLLALDFEDRAYKVVIRVCKRPSAENATSDRSANQESFVMFGPLFCKLQIGGIDIKEAVTIASELSSQKIRGVAITAEGPKLKAEKPVVTEQQLLERAAKRDHEIRRRNRAMERLKHRLSDIPAPGGTVIFSQYRPLVFDVTDSCVEGGGVVDWSTVPQALDPAHNFIENVPLGEDRANEARVAAAALVAKQHIGVSTVPIGRGSARYGGGATTAASSSAGGDSGTTTRAFRKRRQAESFVIALRGMLPADSSAPLHIVDFGSGSGNLCLPLAFLFPQHRFTAVDMKTHSVDLLLQRAQAAGLSNIRGVCGTIEEFAEPFDVSLALHACGQATDYALWQAERCRAAYIVCPCCVGKLKHRRSPAAVVEPDGIAACAPCIVHPRSEWLYRALGGGAAAASLIGTAANAGVGAEEWFGLMAKTGDISHGQAHVEGNFCANNEAVARMCKCHLEVDRNCRMQEVGYRTVLSQLLQSELTSKGDLLAGVPEESISTGRFRWPWPLDESISFQAASASKVTDICSEFVPQ